MGSPEPRGGRGEALMGGAVRELGQPRGAPCPRGQPLRVAGSLRPPPW